MPRPAVLVGARLHHLVLFAAAAAAAAVFSSHVRTPARSAAPCDARPKAIILLSDTLHSQSRERQRRRLVVAAAHSLSPLAPFPLFPRRRTTHPFFLLSRDTLRNQLARHQPRPRQPCKTMLHTTHNSHPPATNQPRVGSTCRLPHRFAAATAAAIQNISSVNTEHRHPPHTKQLLTRRHQSTLLSPSSQSTLRNETTRRSQKREANRSPSPPPSPSFSRAGPAQKESGGTMASKR